jgi:hypothetical protein
MELKLSFMEGYRRTLAWPALIYRTCITFIAFCKHVRPKYKVRRGDTTGVVRPTITTTTTQCLGKKTRGTVPPTSDDPARCVD